MKGKEEVETVFETAVIKSLIAHQPPLDRDKLVESELMADVDMQNTEEPVIADNLLSQKNQ